MDTFRDVPEFFEVELGESLIARTEILGKTPLTLIIGKPSHYLIFAQLPSVNLDLQICVILLKVKVVGRKM